MRRIYLLPLAIVFALALLAVVAYPTIASQLTPKTTASFTTGSHAASGKVGSTLVTPDGVEFTLVGIEQQGNEVLFHLTVHNEQGQQANVWNMDANHGFVLYNSATDTFDSVVTAPAEGDLAAHPVLPNTIDGQGNADGWTAFIQPSPSPYAATLYYYYRTIHTIGCPVPSIPSTPIDQSQCHPAVLYSTLHWDF